MSSIRFGMNAKKIENRVQVNVVKDTRDELRDLLGEYEKKITDIEFERQHDKNKSDKLFKIIEKLQEQKKILASRLLQVSNNENSNRIEEIMKKGGREKVSWDRIHYQGVGLLNVITQEKEEEVDQEI